MLLFKCLVSSTFEHVREKRSSERKKEREAQLTLIFDNVADNEGRPEGSVGAFNADADEAMLPIRGILVRNRHRQNGTC